MQPFSVFALYKSQNNILKRKNKKFELNTLIKDENAKIKEVSLGSLPG